MSAEVVFSRFGSAVLFLTCEVSLDAIKQGSGVLVSADGFLVTNAHVVENCQRVTATYIKSEVRLSFEARIAYYDARTDTAALKISSQGLDYISISKRPGRIGERVYAIGNPRGLEQTISEGILSGQREMDGVPWIQHSAPISPGSSGGALIGAEGDLLGINSFLVADSQNLNFAVPAATLTKAVSAAREVDSTSSSLRAQGGSPSRMAGQASVNLKDGLSYVWIPPGKFTMGCSAGDSQCFPSEQPRHEVEITKGFWLGQTAVTVVAWRRYRNATGQGVLMDADSLGRRLNNALQDGTPTVAISFEMARGYCAWAGGRLPTEAEWEYAARAGVDAARYGSLDKVAWFGDNSGRNPIDITAIWYADPRLESVQKALFENGNGPHEVGQKEPNKWNLYDMLGNVRQWVEDWFGQDYYEHSEKENPRGPALGLERVTRGGSWYDGPILVRASSRLPVRPEYRVNNVGCRCIATNPFSR